MVGPVNFAVWPVKISELGRFKKMLISHTVDIKFHFVRDLVSKGRIILKYCPTETMIADILTKGVTKERFIKLRAMAGLKPQYVLLCMFIR